MVSVERHIPWRYKHTLTKSVLSSMRFYPPLERITWDGESPQASMLAVGDIALGKETESLTSGGTGAIWEGIRPVLDSSDLRVGNLESPFGLGAEKGVLGAYLAVPPEAVQILQAAGFDGVTCANNHMLDFGVDGMRETLRVLDAANIRHCGAGLTSEEARKPALFQTKGLRVAMLGYCDDYRIGSEEKPWQGLAIIQDDQICADIRAARDLADIVVVQIHWGYEFALYPFLSHRERARRYADTGAHAVLCHHAHVPMGLERRGSSLIAYGLGNCVFVRCEYLSDGHPWAYRSVALKIFFSRTGVVEVEIIPLGIMANRRVVLLGGAARAEMLGAMRLLSFRLRKTRKLRAIEEDRLGRETVRWLRCIETYGRDRMVWEELSRLFQTPRQQELISWLLTRGTPWAAKAGARLQAFATQAAPGDCNDAMGDLISRLSAEIRLSNTVLGQVP